MSRKDDIAHVAKLAKLKLTDQELEDFVPQIESILDYMQVLNELDLDLVDFKYNSMLNNVTRDDEVKESLTQEEAVSGRVNTQTDGAFTLNRVVKK